jgi:hypothetical protein
MEDKTPKADERTRPSRVPLGQRNRLTFKGLDPAYSYRLINDQEERLVQAQEAGYEFVTADQQMGDATPMAAKKLGKKVTKPVGHGTTGYLMRIKKDWYDEDQTAKMKRLDETEQAMKPNLVKGEYGSGLTHE